MASNRLTRDEIIHRALDMADAAGLDAKERPGNPPGVLIPNAMSIGWMQDGLDLFHRAFPWSGALTKSSVTYSAETVTAPSDFVIDLRDGLIVTQTNARRRLRRKSLSWMLNYDVSSDATGEPGYYVLIDGIFYLRPIPDTSYTGSLWYYKLPAVLGAGSRPTFPDDWTLVEYVHLRAKEWTGEAPPVSAMEFALKAIAKLRASGLGQEPETDSLEMDPDRFSPSGSGGADPSAWLGSTVPR